MRLIPTLYRDESDKGGTPPDTKPAEQAKPASADAIAAAVVKAVSDRTARAETGVLKSMAEQYGMSEADLKGVLDKAKADKAAQLPEAAHKQIKGATDRANSRLIAAEVKATGADYGLVDAEVALKLMDVSALKVADDGTVSGVKEAMEALKTSRPYLFKSADPAPTGQKKDVGGKVTTATTETTLEQFKRMGYPARVEMKKSNPTLYNTLTEQERSASATGKK